MSMLDGHVDGEQGGTEPGTLGGDLPGASRGLHTVIRGIYAAEDEEDPDFVEVATFVDAQEGRAWYSGERQRCTNPDYSQCKQIYTTLCDWGQVERYLLDKLAVYRSRYPHESLASFAVRLGITSPASTSAPQVGRRRKFGEAFGGYSSVAGSASAADSAASVPLPPGNVFAGEAAMLESVRERLDLPFHASVHEGSTLNTLRHMFFHLRCGIFVMIRRGKLVMFVPFVNKDYTNTWGEGVSVEGGTLEEYAELKAEAFPHSREREKYMADKKRWWANGNIMCNVDTEESGFWGDSYLPQLRHMLQTTCARRAVPDCEFFINKRDFPNLKRNLTEVYDFLYERDDEPMARERYSSYAPILSFFVGAPFADLPMVTTDDWETATGRVFPPSFTELRSEKNRSTHSVPWEKRKSTAFFRGGSTGLGSDPSTHQRLALSALSAAWGKDPRYTAGNGVDGEAFLDAGVVGVSMRDRKEQGEPMSFLKQREWPFKLVGKVPMYAQAAFKYHIYVDGHVAAMRYASMLPLGGVVIKVASRTKADSMWFFPLLKPYDFRSASPDPLGDHIPVAADLSDLAEAITWLKTHDDEAQRIASNSTALYARLVGLEGQLDYMQLLCWEMARRFKSNAELAFAAGAAAGAAGEAEAEAGLDADSSSGSSMSERLLVPGIGIAACPSATAAAAAAGGAGASAAAAAAGGAGAPAAGAAAPCGDWFGADCAAYSNTLIGPSAAPVPRLPECAAATCECPVCEGKREQAAAAAEAQRRAAAARTSAISSRAAAASAGAGGAAPGSLASFAAAYLGSEGPVAGHAAAGGAGVGSGHGASGPGAAPAASAARPGALAGPSAGAGSKLPVPSDRFAKAIAERAALAKQMAEKREKEAAAAAGKRA